MQIQFSDRLEHQRRAIEAITGLFDGLPRASSRPSSDFLAQLETITNWPASEGDGLPEYVLNDNLWRIQHENGLPQRRELTMEEGPELRIDEVAELRRFPEFTIDMETGTGKTYVYLRTIRELHRELGFSKFIIVVPSVAIFEGTKKAWQMTLGHFDGEFAGYASLRAYDGSKPSICKDFATSPTLEVMVMTLAAFSKSTNTIYKETDKLPGSPWKPYEYLQATRPIVLLDEPQNMESDGARRAIRKLHPLFTLRYSATHVSRPNEVYRLTPFEAFRQGLVKRIEVLGITEQDNFNQARLELLEVKTARGERPTALVRTQTRRSDGLTEIKDLPIKLGDNLFKLTNGQEEYADGWTVADVIGREGEQAVSFENGMSIFLKDGGGGVSKRAIFRTQIVQTIRRHFAKQRGLRGRGIKVLSLFFVDRVANYRDADEGFIRQIFDEEFNKWKTDEPFFEKMEPHEVQDAYFASYKKKEKGSATEQEIFVESADETSKEATEAQKRSFELIMKNKELLLTLPEKSLDPKARVAFIFAHSALKEGWDNPNVFQICTLNQSQSERKKRQEIGRGLRLAVDQTGERVHDDGVNVLTVVANESYEEYAAALQKNYEEDSRLAAGDRPPKPSDASKSAVARNERLFRSAEFRHFWEMMSRRATYRIEFDEKSFVRDAALRLNSIHFPLPTIKVESGKFVQTELLIRPLQIDGDRAELKIELRDTENGRDEMTVWLEKEQDLAEKAFPKFLAGEKFILQDLQPSPYADGISVKFQNGWTAEKAYPAQCRSFAAKGTVQQKDSLLSLEPPAIFDILTRAARETKLTKKTIAAIFQKLQQEQVNQCLLNPEGFTERFIVELKKLTARHVAERLVFEIAPNEAFDLEKLFEKKPSFVQNRLETAGANSIYSHIQIDSEVENRFMSNRLRDQNGVIFYFKFPRAFRIELPRIIKEYNPDWGILFEEPNGRTRLELVRETKGTIEKSKLQHDSEQLKVICAAEYFKTLGIDYRVVTDKTVDWWRPDEADQTAFLAK